VFRSASRSVRIRILYIPKYSKTIELTGAKARLFARVCRRYFGAAENACNDKPDEHPIFSWLSPQQRIQLVHEVMVGLLCPDEPLPPETIQHYATYLALVTTIKIEIETELDSVNDVEVGHDLLDGYDDTKDDRRRQTPEEREEERVERIRNMHLTKDGSLETPEEREERIRDIDLISRQAEKNKERIDRAQAGTDTRPMEAFHIPAEADTPSNVFESAQRCSVTMSVLYGGPPVPAEVRRLNRPLTDTEQYAFCWRRLADDALQENTNGFLGALRNADFDWRCTNLVKWGFAVDLLMVVYHDGDVTESEQALVDGEIGEVDYADRSQHARIHAIEKIVKDLRDTYDPFWKPDMLAVDQRAIFAVCSSQLFYSGGHYAWVTGFLAHCEEEGVDFSAGGDYQKRLEIYRRMAPLYKEGLSTAFHQGAGQFDSAKTPADFKRDDPITAKCHVPSCFSSSQRDLKLCSRCKIVSYCSRECQMKDWPDHKKHCKVLAELRKDKAKVSEIVKNF
jgi:hypothetical protein